MSFWDILNLSDSFLIELASVWCSILISLPETPFAALNAIRISYSYFRKGSISLRSDLYSHGQDTAHDWLPHSSWAWSASFCCSSVSGAGCPPWNTHPNWQLLHAAFLCAFPRVKEPPGAFSAPSTFLLVHSHFSSMFSSIFLVTVPILCSYFPLPRYFLLLHAHLWIISWLHWNESTVCRALSCSPYETALELPGCPLWLLSSPAPTNTEILQSSNLWLSQKTWNMFPAHKTNLGRVE